jgi:hypothetical protein
MRLLANLDRHRSHDQAKAKRFDCVPQDVIPGIAALPTDPGSAVRSRPVHNLDRARDDLTAGEGKRHVSAETVGHFEPDPAGLLRGTWLVRLDGRMGHSRLLCRGLSIKVEYSYRLCTFNEKLRMRVLLHGETQH